MKHTKGFLARGGLAAALLLLGIAVARPASAEATITITISRAGTVSGGVATISGWVTTTVGQDVTIYADLEQYLRSSPRSPTPLVVSGFSLIPWERFVPANVPTPWIVSIYPFGGDGVFLAFQLGPAYTFASAEGMDEGSSEAEATVLLKKP